MVAATAMAPVGPVQDSPVVPLGWLQRRAQALDNADILVTTPTPDIDDFYIQCDVQFEADIYQPPPFDWTLLVFRGREFREAAHNVFKAVVGVIVEHKGRRDAYRAESRLMNYFDLFMVQHQLDHPIDEPKSVDARWFRAVIVAVANVIIAKHHPAQLAAIVALFDSLDVEDTSVGVYERLLVHSCGNQLAYATVPDLLVYIGTFLIEHTLPMFVTYWVAYMGAATSLYWQLLEDPQWMMTDNMKISIVLFGAATPAGSPEFDAFARVFLSHMSNDDADTFMEVITDMRRVMLPPHHDHQ